MPRQRANDPVEDVVRRALVARGVAFVEEEDPRAKALDFYLLDWDVHVEVKRFHSPRIADQMARAENVIAVQGMAAAAVFATAIRGGL